MSVETILPSSACLGVLLTPPSFAFDAKPMGPAPSLEDRPSFVLKHNPSRSPSAYFWQQVFARPRALVIGGRSGSGERRRAGYVGSSRRVAGPRCRWRMGGNKEFSFQRSFLGGGPRAVPSPNGVQGAARGPINWRQRDETHTDGASFRRLDLRLRRRRSGFGAGSLRSSIPGGRTREGRTRLSLPGRPIAFPRASRPRGRGSLAAARSSPGTASVPTRRRTTRRLTATGMDTGTADRSGWLAQPSRRP